MGSTSTYDLNGDPVHDLSEDIHEFIEIHNSGETAVDLNGWKISGGIDYNFPIGAVIPAGAYQVVAKDKTRLASIAAYGLTVEELYGPYDAPLSNNRDTIRLKDGQGRTVDAVTYSASFPWAMGADGLGAGDDWIGLKSADYQYRGRSLERVSFTYSPDDPANWLASPLPGEPSPGRPNAAQRSVPQPVVVNLKVAQISDRQILIRSNQPIRVEVLFSVIGSLVCASLV